LNPHQKAENLPALTTLRFVAAMMIVTQHSSQMFKWPWSMGNLPLVHGVSFFFVLSGFILAHVYSGRTQLSYAAFMRARFARLWPVHALSILILCLAIPPAWVTFEGTGLFNKWIALAFNLSLLHSAFPFAAYVYSWNSVSWSISTEMFFYLAFPLLLVNIERTWHWKLLGSALLALIVIAGLVFLKVPADGGIQDLTSVYATYPNPLVRGFEFCLGMATWCLWKKYIAGMTLSVNAWTLIELLAVALCATWLLHVFSWIYGLSTQSVRMFLMPAGSCWIFAILIAVFAMGRGRLGRLLALRPLVYLGEISFSIYMLHQILMKFFIATLEWPEVPEAVYFSLLFLLASLSYLLVEKPAQKLLMRPWGRRVLPPQDALASRARASGP
jgi:peptidoglycan/LPS O-acetylase OafA/YrhL